MIFPVNHWNDSNKTKHNYNQEEYKQEHQLSQTHRASADAVYFVGKLLGIVKKIEYISYTAAKIYRLYLDGLFGHVFWTGVGFHRAVFCRIDVQRNNKKSLKLVIV